MIDKEEDCPTCGASDRAVWHYDFQRCDGCGYRGINPPSPAGRVVEFGGKPKAAEAERDAIVGGMLATLRGLIARIEAGEIAGVAVAYALDIDDGTTPGHGYVWQGRASHTFDLSAAITALSHAYTSAELAR